MPSSVKTKMSFERRRWVHLFPLTSDGAPIYPNWTVVQTESSNMNDASKINFKSSVDRINDTFTTNGNINKFNAINTNTINDGSNGAAHSHINSSMIKGARSSPEVGSSMLSGSAQRLNKYDPSIIQQPGLTHHKLSLVPTNEKRRGNKHNASGKDFTDMLNVDEPVPTMVTGVAWKSLTMPACLPLTTDFCPKRETLTKSFVCSSNYCLLLDEIREQYGYESHKYDKISMAQVFTELVGHRLAMGFQIVVPKATFRKNNDKESTQSPSSSVSACDPPFICDLNESFSQLPRTEPKSIKGYYKLSLGRIYHELFYKIDSSNRTESIQVQSMSFYLLNYNNFISKLKLVYSIL
jgi:DEP domain-containing protein 5